MTNSLTYDVPLMSTRYAKRFLRFMQSRGVGTEALLANTGVTLETLQNPEAFLSVNQVVAILEQADWLAGDERLGFQFGQQLDLIAHGLFGYVLLSQEDYRSIVERVVQHLRICLPLIDMDFRANGNDTFIRLRETWNLGGARPFLTKVYMGSIYTITSRITQKIRIDLDFESQLAPDEWRAIAPDAEFRFSAVHSQVSLPLIGKDQQDTRLKVAYSLARERCRETEREQTKPNEIVSQVREMILKAPGRATLERTAQQLNMSDRYLRQHLSQAGVSFRELRNEIRRSYADLYLSESPVPLEDIARKLGFSDQASFTRAYRAWTGRTPGEVRRCDSRTGN